MSIWNKVHIYVGVSSRVVCSCVRGERDSERERLTVCVCCVCVSEREREREGVNVHLCMPLYVCVVCIRVIDR
jgi:hypothetical protein